MDSPTPIEPNKESQSSRPRPVIDNQILGNWTLGLCILIIILMPFHGFISTWLGSSFGALLLFKAWKELLLVPIIFLGVYLFLSDIKLRRYLFAGDKKSLIFLIGIFIFWQFAAAALGGQNMKALILGLAIQIRWGIFFICCLIATYYKPVSRRRLLMLLLIPASFVVGFGLLQMFILPHDFLAHFGYQKGVTIPPFFTIDEQLDQIRIASTLRGPNPLGVYLILPILVGVWLLVAGYWRKAAGRCLFNFSHLSFVHISYFIFLISTLAVMYGSHSRGAWLGLIASLFIAVVLSVAKKYRYLIIIVCLGAALVGGFGVYSIRDSNFVQDAILHDDPESGGATSSNKGHLDSLVSGISNVKQRLLLGCGAGCAGPASAHNINGASISENYFIQTAEESGLVGLALLVSIFLFIARRILLESEDSEDFMKLALLASFIGVGVASLTAHAWADDTIAYVWWGIAGFVMYNKTNNEQKNDKNKEKIKESIKKTITSKS